MSIAAEASSQCGVTLTVQEMKSLQGAPFGEREAHLPTATAARHGRLAEYADVSQSALKFQPVCPSLRCGHRASNERPRAGTYYIAAVTGTLKLRVDERSRHGPPLACRAVHFAWTWHSFHRKMLQLYPHYVVLRNGVLPWGADSNRYLQTAPTPPGLG